MLHTAYTHTTWHIYFIFIDPIIKIMKSTIRPLVPKFAGSNPAEAVRFLRAKKSSVCLPSEGK